MREAGASIRESVAPLLWFALVYVAPALVWWYMPAFAELDLALLDIVVEMVIFGCAVGIAGHFLKRRRPDLTKRDRHVFALGCVAIMWAALVAMIAVEYFQGSFGALSDLLEEADSASLGLGMAAGAAVVVVLASLVYYFLARLILHFVASPNRIAPQ